MLAFDQWQAPNQENFQKFFGWKSGADQESQSACSLLAIEQSSFTSTRKTVHGHRMIRAFMDHRHRYDETPADLNGKPSSGTIEQSRDGRQRPHVIFIGRIEFSACFPPNSRILIF